MESIRIGAVEITALQDTTLTLEFRTFLPQFAEQMDREDPSRIGNPLPFLVAVTSYLVRSGSNLVLVDTGMGPRTRSGFEFPLGQLDEVLRGIGVAPGDITHVAHTHLHLDHVGWNTIQNADGSFTPFFPNAKYTIQQAEWDYWMTPEHLPLRRNQHLRECVEPLKDSVNLVLVDGEKPIDENLTFVSTPGHTPGHVAIGVYSEGERGVIIGDASHHPVQLLHPDWSPSADWDPLMSAPSREKLFDDAEADGRRWVAGHWPFPGFGRIVRLDGQRVFQSVEVTEQRP